MKNKTALKRSVASIRFLSVVVAIMLLLAIRYPSKYTVIPLAIFALYLGGDAYNVYRIKKRAASDPTFLDERLN